MTAKKISIFLMLAITASILFSCTLQKDPKAVLAEAMEKRLEVNSAVFTLISVGLKGSKYVKNESRIYVERNEQTPETPFKFRIEEAGGKRISAFDGNKFVSIDREEKTAFIVKKEHKPEKFASRVNSIIGRVMETADKKDALAKIYQMRGYKYNGEGNVYGQHCEILNFRSPAFQPNSEWIAETYKGINDGFTWKTHTKLYANGLLIQENEEILKDVQTNVDIDESMFTEAVPTTYEIEYYGEEKEEAPKEKPELIKAGETAPDWTLTDGDGNKVTLSSLRGNVVVLDFWGTWCVWCIVAMPKIQNIYEATKDMPVKVFGVSCREPEDADPAKFLKDKGIEYPALLNGDDAAKSYGVSGYPSLVIVGPDGKIAYSTAGYDQTMDIQIIQIIKKILNKPA